jgi:hypothetical protein
VSGASKLEKSVWTRSSIPLKALITQIIAAATKATTVIEIIEIILMMFRDFFANK